MGAVPSERELTVVDDFSGKRLDRTRWVTSYRWHIGLDGSRNEGNDEEEWYLDEQVSLVDGKLRLTADDRPVTGRHPTPRQYLYRSGMVSALWSFTYGSIEIRARFPHGPGLWPALWLIPDDLSWPPEIDIVEVFGESATMAHTFHPRDAPTSPAPAAVAQSDWVEDLSARLGPGTDRVVARWQGGVPGH